MTRLTRLAPLFVLALIGLVATGPTRGSRAQDATPAATPTAGDRLDLAAMALDTAALPSGVAARLQYEWYVRGDQFADYSNGVFTPAEVAATGLIRFYESALLLADGQQTVRSYLSEYPTPEAAAAGFALLEDEARSLPPGASVEDRAGPEAGEAPSETTVGTYRFPDGPEFQVVDATFRVGRLIAGVAVEAPGGAAPPDPALAETLAAALERRITAVLGGQAPAGVDPSLPARLLPLDALDVPARGRLPFTYEGYLSASDAMAPEGAGTPNADAGAAASPVAAAGAGYDSGYRRSVALLFVDEPEPTLAEALTVAVLDFASPAAAAAALGAAGAFPLSAPVMPIYEAEPAAGAPVPGADATGAYRARSFEGGPVDSYRLAFVVADRLAVVEVANAVPAENAEAIARDLAAQQAACLTGGGACAAVEVPAVLATAPGAVGATPQP